MPLIRPNTTQVPNEVFDRYMGVLTPNAFIVLAFLIRQTYGFQRSACSYSVSQISDGIKVYGKKVSNGTGLARGSIMKALKELESIGAIRVTHGDRTTANFYELILFDEKNNEGSSPDEQGCSPRELGGSSPRELSGNQGQRNSSKKVEVEKEDSAAALLQKFESVWKARFGVPVAANDLEKARELFYAYSDAARELLATSTIIESAVAKKTRADWAVSQIAVDVTKAFDSKSKSTANAPPQRTPEEIARRKQERLEREFVENLRAIETLAKSDVEFDAFLENDKKSFERNGLSRERMTELVGEYHRKKGS